ncbi:MAG: pantetheine-phosphate adenylyltransferase [Pseudomonadota bacterium]|nr:pantetheine-phosphate adenylyltransferase [Pseudomonadota bacterium]
MATTGFYPGSFDPVTNGHVDIITRAARLVDKLVIGIGVHHGKKPLFSADERVAMLKEIAAPIGKAAKAEIVLTTFDNLSVDAARKAGATMMIRGLRDGTDLDYEMQLAGMNGAMAEDIETVFLAASPEVRHVTATIVRQIASMGGDTSPFVPMSVQKLLKSKF